MKLFVIIITLTIGLVYADDMRCCITNDDCNSGECCISMVFVRGFCHMLGQQGDHCITKPAETTEGSRNLFGCPCVDDLKCIPEVTRENGITVHKNPTCKTNRE